MALFPASVVAVLDSWGVTSNQLGQQEVELLTQILACQTVIAANGGGGGGSSSPGLPVWTFQASDGSNPTAGGFTTDTANPDAPTSLLKFNTVTLNGSSAGGALGELPFNITTLILVGPTGIPQFFEVVTVSQSADITSIEVGGLGLTHDAWNGNYQVSAWPYNFATLAQIFSAASITPIVDGTYFGITFQKGIAVSAATPQADGTVSPVTSGTIGSGGALLNLS